MNTASRMESNGVRNRIQVSEATAEELRAFGKSDWLVPREDKIFAKGKGEMQTYCKSREMLEFATFFGSHFCSCSFFPKYSPGEKDNTACTALGLSPEYFKTKAEEYELPHKMMFLGA